MEETLLKNIVQKRFFKQGVDNTCEYWTVIWHREESDLPEHFRSKPVPVGLECAHTGPLGEEKITCYNTAEWDMVGPSMIFWRDLPAKGKKERLTIIEDRNVLYGVVEHNIDVYICKEWQVKEKFQSDVHVPPTLLDILETQNWRMDFRNECTLSIEKKSRDRLTIDVFGDCVMFERQETQEYNTIVFTCVRGPLEWNLTLKDIRSEKRIMYGKLIADGQIQIKTNPQSRYITVGSVTVCII